MEIVVEEDAVWIDDLDAEDDVVVVDTDQLYRHQGWSGRFELPALVPFIDPPDAEMRRLFDEVVRSILSIPGAIAKTPKVVIRVGDRVAMFAVISR